MSTVFLGRGGRGGGLISLCDVSFVLLDPFTISCLIWDFSSGRCYSFLFF